MRLFSFDLGRIIVGTLLFYFKVAAVILVFVFAKSWIQSNKTKIKSWLDRLIYWGICVLVAAVLAIMVESREHVTNPFRDEGEAVEFDQKGIDVERCFAIFLKLSVPVAVGVISGMSADENQRESSNSSDSCAD